MTIHLGNHNAVLIHSSYNDSFTSDHAYLLTNLWSDEGLEFEFSPVMTNVFILPQITPLIVMPEVKTSGSPRRSMSKRAYDQIDEELSSVAQEAARCAYLKRAVYWHYSEDKGV